MSISTINIYLKTCHNNMKGFYKFFSRFPFFMQTIFGYSETIIIKANCNSFITFIWDKKLFLLLTFVTNFALTLKLTEWDSWDFQNSLFSILLSLEQKKTLSTNGASCYARKDLIQGFWRRTDMQNQER